MKSPGRSSSFPAEKYEYLYKKKSELPGRLSGVSMISFISLSLSRSRIAESEEP